MKKEKVFPLYLDLNQILIYTREHWKSLRFGPFDQGEVAPLHLFAEKSTLAAVPLSLSVNRSSSLCTLPFLHATIKAVIVEQPEVV